jgi:hypothetical protein
MILRRAGVTAALALAFTIPATAAQAAPPGWPWPPIPNISALMPNVSALMPGLYAVNVHSFQCLSAAGGPVSERRCTVDDANRWKLTPASLDGRFQIRNEDSGRCLVPSGEARLATGSCTTTAAGTWRFRDAPGTGIYVVNALSGRCLTVERDGSAVQYRCDGDVSRRWTFRSKPNGKGVVVVNGGKP